MKKFLAASGFISLVLGLFSCTAHGDNPGHAYMPDMYYSRAYETYGYNDVGGELDSLKSRHIFYNAMPVPGTVARGEMMSYHLTDDSLGLKAAELLKNPLDSMAATTAPMKEAERLYLVNCAICHGPQLDGNGPIVAGVGKGGYTGVPAVLNAPNIKSLSDGHYFYVITYGIRTMGSYASQLTPQQRWWVIKYLRSKQGGSSSGSPKDSSTAVGKVQADTAVKGK